jgi:DNA-repair protein XRCC1
MSPQESRNETNQQRVRMFRAQELNKAVLNEKWDRIRVVCTQPFNQHVKYGLSFITVHTEEESTVKVLYDLIK